MLEYRRCPAGSLAVIEANWDEVRITGSVSMITLFLEVIARSRIC